MAISQSQFCINLLTEYFNPGGPLNTKSQITNDIRRPLLSANIISGFRITSTNNVEVELSGIIDQKGDNLFSAECFSFDCFNESGLETSIDNVSDICIVDTGTETKYMDKDQRTNAGLNCYVNSFGKKQFFVRGTLDKNNAVYLADFGIVNPIFGNRIIIERNVPFFFKKKVGSIFARTNKSLPAGIRVVTIKKVTNLGLEVVGSIYGQLEQEFYFPHNILKSGRSFTYNDQQIDLENLSLNLLLFTSFKRFQAKSNQFIYRNNNYSSPEIESIIINSASTLSNLINTDSTVPQLGTIPKTITSYLNTEDQYNSEADRFYLEEVLSCFDSTCFDDLCFQKLVNRSLIERTVSNRSLAWVVLFFASYSINYSDDVSVSINSILEYLLTQRDSSTRLFYEGWDQIEEECVEFTLEDENELLLEDESDICLEGPVDQVSNTYDTSLEQDSEIVTSTNVAILMALLKGFELTQNFKYLTLACDLHISIEKYLLGNSGLYNQSLNVKRPTIESVTYQLQVIQILQDFKNVTTVVNFFKARLVAPPTEQLEPVLVGTDDVLVGTDFVFIDKILSQSDADIDNILFTPTADDNISTIDDIFKYNYLAYSGLLNLNNTVLVDFIDTIEDKYNLIENQVIDNRINSALTFSIGCIIKNESFLTFDNSKFNTLIDFYNLKFQKESIFNSMLNSLPINFGWFNEETLNRRSHIGALMYAQAGELAVVNTQYEYLTRISSIDNLYGVMLNNRANDFGLVRFNKETDTSLRNRIKTELIKRSSNITAIQQKLNQFNSEALINDNYKATIATEDFEDSLFSTNWGEGYLPGPNLVNTNIFTVQLNQPLEVEVREELEKIKPAGMKLKVYETFTFRIGAEIGQSTAINIIDVAGGCDGLDTENNNDYVTESGDPICLEDNDSIILPFTPAPPILPPLDNPPEEESTCDCISLRGYITIDTVATQVRNMRLTTINSIDDAFDVNATNDTLEPCNLVIKNKTNNLVGDYIEAFISPLPFELQTPLPPQFLQMTRIDRVVPDSGTNTLFSFIEFVSQQNGQQAGNEVYVYKETGAGPNQKQVLPGINNSAYEVKQTDNYLLVVKETTIIVINKTTLQLSSISTNLSNNINSIRVINNPNNTEELYIYSNNSSDGLVYHYTWSELDINVLSLIGTLGTNNPSTITTYFATSNELERLDQSISNLELLSVNNFGVEATIKHQLTSIQDTIKAVKNINGFNYFTTVNEQSPFNVVNVYQQKDNVVKFLYTDTALGELSYPTIPLNTSFNMTGELFQLEDYILMAGSNKAYSLSSQSVGSINSFICTSDTQTLDPSFAIQAISETPAGTIVTMVNLLGPQWLRYITTQTTKTC